jgi:amino acid transporter
MAVAAAHLDWFPDLFSVVGRVSLKPSPATSSSTTPGNTVKEPESDAPINAIILSAVLSSLYILLGSFRALLTFNGIGEYTFFFLTVVGAIVLRYREPELARPYKPAILVPATFALVSGFVVLRGAIFAPTQAVILVGLWGFGLGFYWVRGLYQEYVEE